MVKCDMTLIKRLRGHGYTLTVFHFRKLN